MWDTKKLMKKYKKINYSIFLFIAIYIDNYFVYFIVEMKDESKKPFFHFITTYLLYCVYNCLQTLTFFMWFTPFTQECNQVHQCLKIKN